MEIMISRVPFPHRRTFSRVLRFGLTMLAAAAAFGTSATASAYSLTGKSWPSGTVTFQLNLGNSLLSLTDGSTSWNAAVTPALDTWNANMGRIQLRGVNSSGGASTGDRVNSVVFSSSVFGQSFGNGTLAVTYYIMQGSNLLEADVLFNSAMSFNSYRGDLIFGGNGFVIADIRRVFLHEIGHALGLNHFEGVSAIMNAMVSNREELAADDIAGIQAIYGQPAAPPPPSPTPTPTPTPTPAPTPAPVAASHLANISTRMKVGVGDDVLIGGFIIQGGAPKKVILRAIGPSLTAAGVSGAMSDPILELYNSSGNLVAHNDDWQSGVQAAEITASGVQPSHQLESALIATLNPGAYTAIVRGQGQTQGVAMVEGYRLDTGDARLVNLSTRGRIGVGDDVLIGGFIVTGTASKRVIVRALGPSLSGSLAGAIANPTLEMYNSSGTIIASNDDWGSSPQKSEIVASTVPPDHPLESAVVVTLAPGSYTAIVRGVDGGTGVGLVQLFDLEP